jgi:hypothetical protein
MGSANETATRRRRRRACALPPRWRSGYRWRPRCGRGGSRVVRMLECAVYSRASRCAATREKRAGERARRPSHRPCLARRRARAACGAARGGSFGAERRDSGAVSRVQRRRRRRSGCVRAGAGAGGRVADASIGGRRAPKSGAVGRPACNSGHRCTATEGATGRVRRNPCREARERTTVSYQEAKSTAIRGIPVNTYRGMSKSLDASTSNRS